MDSIAQETDFNRVMILKGVSPHLQCPGCHNLIQDPRVLVCSHTYCRACLDNTVRKTVSFSKLKNYSNPAYKPNAAKSSVSGNSGCEAEDLLPDSISLDYTLQTFLGTSLNGDLKGQIFDPDFSGLEQSLDRVGCYKKVPNSSKAAGRSSGKSKKSRKQQDSTPTGKANSNGGSCSSSSSSTSSINNKSPTVSVPMAESISLSKKQAAPEPDQLVEVLVCPECGVHTEIPGGNISLIPYNFFVQHIMDLMTFYSSAEPVPLVYCSTCRKDGLEELPSAVARCSTCASFLCKQCFELHCIDDFTKLHSTLTITERESSMFSCLTPDDSKIRTCKSHSWKPFLFYCITCSKGICETCSKKEHKLHLFSKPEDLRSDFVTYIRALMSRSCQLRRRMEGGLRTTQELMGSIQLLAATQIEEVLRTQDVLTSALDTRLNVLMQEVDKLTAANDSVANDSVKK